MNELQPRENWIQLLQYSVIFSSVAIVLEYAAPELSQLVTDLKRQLKVRKNG